MTHGFEDEYHDIVGKARRGLGITVEQAAAASGLSRDEVQSLERSGGIPEEAALRALGAALALSPGKLADFALRPEPPSVHASPPFVTRLIPSSTYASNTYLLVCPQTRRCAVIDPGADARAIISAIEKASLRPQVLFLTHAHSDHTAATGALQEMFHADAFSLEEVSTPAGVGLARDGEKFLVGNLTIVMTCVPGHTRGGALLNVINAPVAFTGDSLFARSVGGPGVTGDAYRRYLDAIRREILGLASQTVLCPGHGPLTTTADESRLNPFFP